MLNQVFFHFLWSSFYFLICNCTKSSLKNNCKNRSLNFPKFLLFLSPSKKPTELLTFCMVYKTQAASPVSFVTKENITWSDRRIFFSSTRLADVTISKVTGSSNFKNALEFVSQQHTSKEFVYNELHSGLEMKDDGLLEEIVYLNITTNKYLMEASAQYSGIYFLLWHARETEDYVQVLKLWQHFGCLAVYWKLRDRD